VHAVLRPPASAPAESTPGLSPDAECPPPPTTFEEIYERHFAFLWRSLRALGVPATSLDDAAQDVLAVVHRRIRDFQGRAAPRTWLFAIARHVAQNHLRTQRRKLAPLRPLAAPLESPGPSPVSQLEAREAARIVERYCDSLDEERRALFVLGLIEQLPAPEIAECLGIPVNTVYSRVRALRQGLKQALDAEDGP
jgi:RNA polymerase sigma-70 factor (ECF subfamily)